MENLMTVKECATALNLRPWAVYQKIKAGQIPCVRFGRTVRIPPERLQALIDSQSNSIEMARHQGSLVLGTASPPAVRGRRSPTRTASQLKSGPEDGAD
jgi:excisionase family DNA binding protein